MTRSERRAFYLYRSLARFAEVLPVSGIRFLSRVAGRLGPLLNPTKAQLVRSNLRRVAGVEPTDEDVRDAFASYVRYWLQAFRLPVVPRDYLERVVTAEGFEHIVAAREAGKGVIFALPHVGNWDVIGAWLAARDIPLVVVAERLHPQELHQWFEDFRSSLGMTVVVNGPDVAGKLTVALNQNQAIALLCDRDVDGTGHVYDFFDEQTKLPRGPALLALRTGAALLPVGCYETPDGFLAHVDAPVSAERSKATLHEDVDRVTQELAHRVEQLIRREPTQWHLFQPNWPSDRATVSDK
jgi:KDO2-lipid IV(A) lauroyltransferase